MIALREKVALITDIHANDEAFKAILEDIKKRKIDYTFSLGDLVGLGPSPSECVDLAMKNGIINILGNNDCYCILPLETYSHLNGQTTSESYQNAVWTREQLNKKQLDYLRSMPPSIDIKMNGKKIGLCHFPVDSRYFPRAVWSYEVDGTAILDCTNTPRDEKHNIDPNNKGIILANKKPIFDGKTTKDYDAIIFGHYHFERHDYKNNGNSTNFHSLNASGVAIDDYAIYYILSPSKKGYHIQKIKVPYNKEKLYDKLDSISYPKKDTFKEYIMKI